MNNKDLILILLGLVLLGISVIRKKDDKAELKKMAGMGVATIVVLVLLAVVSMFI